jgi:hypothetical protein
MIRQKVKRNIIFYPKMKSLKETRICKAVLRNPGFFEATFRDI